MRELLRGLSSDALAAAVGAQTKKPTSTPPASATNILMPDATQRRTGGDREREKDSGSLQSYPQQIPNEREGFHASGTSTPVGMAGENRSANNIASPSASQTSTSGGLIAKLSNLSFKNRSQQQLHHPQGMASSLSGSEGRLNEASKERGGVSNMLGGTNGGGSLLSQRRPVPITPTQLVHYISRHTSSTSTSKLPFPPETSVLLIDLRHLSEYSKHHIRTAVNVNLPPIIIKRFRRGSVSTFQVEKFLTGDESRTAYDAWKNGGGNAEGDARKGDGATDDTGVEKKQWVRAMVVYDEDMNDRNKETDAWALINTLATGWVDDGEGKMFFGWVKGGLKGFLAMDGAEKYIVRSDTDGVVVDGIPLSDGPVDALKTGGLVLDRDAPESKPKATHRDTPMPLDDAPIPFPQRRKQSAFSIITTPPQQPPNQPTQTQSNTLPQPPTISHKPRMRAQTLGTTTADRPFRPAPPSLMISKPGGGGPSGARGKGGSLTSLTTAPPTLSHLPAPAASPLREEPTPTTPSLKSATIPPTPNNTPANPSQSIAPSQTSPTSLPTPIEPISTVLPYLLLGSDAIPSSPDAVERLKTMGVTHVLNLAKEVPDERVVSSGEFVVRWLKWEDHSEFDTEGGLREAVGFIGEFLGLSMGEGVLRWLRCVEEGRRPVFKERPEENG
ncbi:hypothetical protein HDV00_005427 [Rhizophlyctis rosea]|nr:hypothetical protein HDV00_005427 [Rhizophlyctis rosea]